MGKSSFGFDTYLSPFTWRYGSPEMRSLFSLLRERVLLPAAIWSSVATVQSEITSIPVSKTQALGIQGAYKMVNRSERNAEDVLDRSLKLEATYRHDVIATKEVFAETCAVGGEVVHHGMTSMDIVNNVEAFVLYEALEIVKERLIILVDVLAAKMASVRIVGMGWTHLVAAEPVPYVYRLAQYLQDLESDLLAISGYEVKCKGFKGAVGTSASYAHMLEGSNVTPQEFEENVLKELASLFEWQAPMKAFLVTNQTIPRKQDLEVLHMLSSLAGSLYRLAQDLRILNSSPFMEISFPSKRGQKGSSAMPGKPPNPIDAENICSMARLVDAFVNVAAENARASMLERTLDDSGNRRVFMPEAFMVVDDMLAKMTSIIEGLVVNEALAKEHLEQFGPFAGTERLLVALVSKGMDRKVAHDLLNEISVKAWGQIRLGNPNPLIALCKTHPEISGALTSAEINALFRAVPDHVGDSLSRAHQLVRQVGSTINKIQTPQEQ